MATKKTKVNTVTKNETKKTKAQVQEQEQLQVPMPEWADKVPDGAALAMLTGTRKNKEDMPLLILTIVDKRERNRFDRVDEITVCPFRGYSFALGGSNGGGCYADSTVVGLGNIVSAAELYTSDQSLFDSVVCSSNIKWGADGSASKILLKGLLCEALINWLDNAYGDGIILNPRYSVINKYIDEVLEWLEQYRVITANDRIKSHNMIVDKLVFTKKEKSKLESKNKELEKEILRYKAAAAFSQVTIEELNEERKNSISKKELKERLAIAAASLKRK